MSVNLLHKAARRYDRATNLEQRAATDNSRAECREPSWIEPASENLVQRCQEGVVITTTAFCLRGALQLGEVLE